MTQHVEAVYENGVLRPLGPVRLKERQHVALTIQERQQAVPNQAAEVNEGDAEPRPWRGVFVPGSEREVVFTKEVATAALPPWEPEIFPHPRRVRNDDE